MDWMYFTPERAAATYESLGHYAGDKFKIAHNAQDTLETLIRRLLDEDKTLRTFRRSLGFSQIITKDLAPILLATKDDEGVFMACVR